MQVRIRFESRRFQPGSPGAEASLIAGVAALLSPVALMAAVLGIWGISADMGIASEFAISEGAFSHWQVWIGLALAIQTSAVILDKYGSRDTRTEYLSRQSERF